MPVIAALVEAIEHVNATAGRKISGGSPRAFADEAELLMHWDEAGFVNVTAERIAVGRTYPTFDDLWRPLLVGSTKHLDVGIAGARPTRIGAPEPIGPFRFLAGRNY